MSQLTLEIPESLKLELERQAEREGVSLQHYVVYSLARLVSASDLEVQRIAFDELTTRYPQEEAERALQNLLASRQPSS